MRYGYWIDAILGLVLIVSPYVGKFAQDHTALYVNVAVGILLVVWAIVSYLNPGQKMEGMRHSHA
jgi:hypothetical protein